MTAKPIQFTKDDVRHALLGVIPAFILVALIVLVFSFPVVRDLFNFDQSSQSAEIPLYIPQSLIPIGLSIMAFMVVVRLITGGDRSGPSTPSH